MTLTPQLSFWKACISKMDFKLLLTSTQVLVEERSLYAGQPVGMVVAEDRNTAICAAALVKVEYEDIQKPVLTIKEAIQAGRVKVAQNFQTMKTETSRQGDAEGVSRKLLSNWIGEVFPNTYYQVLEIQKKYSTVQYSDIL